MKIGSVDLNNLRGITDKFAGLGKELVGTVTGNERWQEEGQAQQERAAENLKAIRKQAKAEEHEAKAEAMERKQKAAQRAKS